MIIFYRSYVPRKVSKRGIEKSTRIIIGEVGPKLKPITPPLLPATDLLASNVSVVRLQLFRRNGDFNLAICSSKIHPDDDLK